MSTTPATATKPKPEPVMYAWDTEAIFRKSGGTARLIDLLIKYGFRHPSVGTIYAWKSRKSIPADWLANVVYALLKDGVGIHEIMKIETNPRPEPLE